MTKTILEWARSEEKLPEGIMLDTDGKIRPIEQKKLDESLLDLNYECASLAEIRWDIIDGGACYFNDADELLCYLRGVDSEGQPMPEDDKDVQFARLALCNLRQFDLLYNELVAGLAVDDNTARDAARNHVLDQLLKLACEGDQEVVGQIRALFY